MSKATANISLDGAMGLIKKSKEPFAPLYEAITNSWEAILQKSFKKGETAEIRVTFNFTGLVDEVKELVSVEVVDNGIGYNSENYNRFKTLLDNTKGYNNRGSGRLQFLHRFGQVDITSFFEEDGKQLKRKFSCDAARFVFSHSCVEETDWRGSGSVTLMKAPDTGKEKEFFDKLSLDDVFRELKRHFLLRFYLDVKKGGGSVPTIIISFVKNDKELETALIDPNDIPKPQETNEIKLHYVRLRDSQTKDIIWEKIKDKEETISWAHFKFSDTALDKNGIFLCSKGVPVESLSFKHIKKSESVNGNRYQTVFYGGVLDNEDFVSHSVDSFLFPEKRDIERQAKEDLLFDPSQEFLFIDEIKEKVQGILPQIYSDVINVQEAQQKDIEDLARKHGIPVDIALKAKIGLNDSKEKILEKIYKQHAEHLAQENQKTEKMFEELENLNPTSDTYQEDLETKCQELLERIPQQNKEELSRYVIRRDMVTKIIQMILSQRLICQTTPLEKGERRNKEALLHDLVFKRKTTSDGLNDLWVLSEEFVHFSGTSELPLDKISDAEGQKLLKDLGEEVIKENGLKPKRRPDVFLFADEGKCVLIEFKAPEEDLSNHLNQMGKYCNLIANYGNVKIDKFFCYLIGETFNKIDLPGEYVETIDGNWVKPEQKIRAVDGNSFVATSQIELIRFSSVIKRAQRRNKSFADKLGLSDVLREQED